MEMCYFVERDTGSRLKANVGQAPFAQVACVITQIVIAEVNGLIQECSGIINFNPIIRIVFRPGWIGIVRMRCNLIDERDGRSD